MAVGSPPDRVIAKSFHPEIGGALLQVLLEILCPEGKGMVHAIIHQEIVCILYVDRHLV